MSFPREPFMTGGRLLLASRASSSAELSAKSSSVAWSCALKSDESALMFFSGKSSLSCGILVPESHVIRRMATEPLLLIRTERRGAGPAGAGAAEDAAADILMGS